MGDAGLEDELHEQDRPGYQNRDRDAALFGDDDEDEEYQPAEEPVDDDVDDGTLEFARGNAVPQEGGSRQEDAQPESKMSMKEKLQALAKKKKDQADKETKRKDKSEKKDKSKKRQRGEEGKEKRLRRTPGASAPPKKKAHQGPQEDVDSDDMQENADDEAFIDDEGAGPDQEEEPLGSDIIDDDDDNAGAMPAPEALEVAPGEEEEADDAIENMFGRNKKKRKKETDQQMSMVVDDKIAKMEAAAEMDMEEHAQQRPAINKLKMLQEVEEFLAQRKYHELFIHSGGLGVLKAWLEPYHQDGSLPNVRVRSAILNICKLLPIDTAREDMKENLKKSQLGSRIMFLAKCPDETQTNKKSALELVQRWSRPIFFDADIEAEKRRQREEQLRKARLQMQVQQRQVDDAQAEELAAKSKIKYGQPGYRWHANIPQASKLDYIVEPERDERLVAAAAAAGGKRDEGRFGKKMREVQRKLKGNTARAAMPSVEGRGIVLMGSS